MTAGGRGMTAIDELWAEPEDKVGQQGTSILSKEDLWGVGQGAEFGAG